MGIKSWYKIEPNMASLENVYDPRNFSTQLGPHSLHYTALKVGPTRGQ